MKPKRSHLVSWLLGASVVALVTFSFDALSARGSEPNRCPATGAMSSVGAPAASSCPAMKGKTRCPVTGATATPAAPRGRCPAGGNVSDPTKAGLSI